MRVFDRGRGREDGAFEMRRGGPILKYGAIGIGVVLVLLVLSIFLLRVAEMEMFTHGILRDVVRNSLNEVASTYVVEDIYGEKKAEFLGKVQSKIEQKMSPVGVSVQQFGFIGAPRVPAVIATAITAKAQAIQQAERARNELATTQAETAKKNAEAKGDPKSLGSRAQGGGEG